MSKSSTFIFFRTLTSLHAGSGEDTGFVDLPIQRELVTGFPKIESSTLKGCIRSRMENLGADPLKIHLAFGFDQDSHQADFPDGWDKQFRGALSFFDARLLFFPMRAKKGVFALVTCPYVLKRFAEDLSLSEKNIAQFSAIEDLANINLYTDSLTTGACLALSTAPVILEEYVFEVKSEETPKLSAFITAFQKLVAFKLDHLVLLDDDAFADFVQLYTERITRNKIGEEGVVKDGGLFTEEYLPAESVLYGLVQAEKPNQRQGKIEDKLSDFNRAEQVLEFFKTELLSKNIGRRILQVGGNATIGKGIVEALIP